MIFGCNDPDAELRRVRKGHGLLPARGRGGRFGGVRRLAILFFSAVSLLRASAHDVGLSTAEVRCGPERIGIEVVVAIKDLETLFELDANKDGRVTPAEFSASEEAIGRYLVQACLLRVNGESVQAAATRSSLDQTNNVLLSLSFPARGLEEASVRFDLVTDLPEGHRMLVSVLNSAGTRLAEKLVTQASPEIAFSAGKPMDAGVAGALPSFFGFVKLGVEHIGTGYDHLLFLFALLLVTKNFRASIAVITCFTLAHSVTLAAATFNLVALPGRITEPLIAATIVYVGLENLLRKGEPRGRWALTFCFGLVHGFGFASVLREMGVGGSARGVTLPLLGFNLGVELGQLAIAAVLLPFIWKLRATPLFLSRAVPACSACVVLVGGYWLVQRLWG